MGGVSFVWCFFGGTAPHTIEQRRVVADCVRCLARGRLGSDFSNHGLVCSQGIACAISLALLQFPT
eukprot:724856-Amphidinium_carterae.1